MCKAPALGQKGLSTELARGLDFDSNPGSCREYINAKLPLTGLQTSKPTIRGKLLIACFSYDHFDLGLAVWKNPELLSTFELFEPFQEDMARTWVFGQVSKLLVT